MAVLLVSTTILKGWFVDTDLRIYYSLQDQVVTHMLPSW